MKKFLVLVSMFLISCGSAATSPDLGNVPGNTGGGTDGKNGTSCSVIDTPDGLVVKCTDGTTATVKDGGAGVKGEKGDTGATGLPGKDGNDNKVVATLYCSGTTIGSIHSTLNGLTINYWATVTKSGDVWASAEVGKGSVDYTSSSRFYSSQQNGATDAGVTIGSDWYTPYNGGWWDVSVNRNTGVATVKYNDTVNATFVFAASACSIQKY